MSLAHRIIENPTDEELAQIESLLSRYDQPMPDLRLAVFNIVEDVDKKQIVACVVHLMKLHIEPWVVDRLYYGQINYDQVYQFIEDHAKKYKLREYEIRTDNTKIAERLSHYGMIEYQGHTMVKITPYGEWNTR